MIRRKIFFFLNLFAFTIALALMILPHHHHDGDVCILNASCHSDHSDDGDEDESHDHTSCNNEHSCILEQEIVFRSNNIENIIKASESVDNRSGIDGIWISPFRTSLLCSVPPVNARLQIGSHSSMYSRFVNLSIGLRGPPTV